MRDAITFKQKSNFSKTIKHLNRIKSAVTIDMLKKYGEQGVAALASATPVDSGKTANSWNYKIEKNRGSIAISFFNSNIQNGVPIAILIQYGHGTRNGGWVQGRDYINPAIQPIFDQMTREIWREVTKR